jgi:hypothetical protein
MADQAKAPFYEESPERIAMRPRVVFDSKNIWHRLETCETVARAYGWDPKDLITFVHDVRTAFSYEEAMSVIEGRFEIAASPFHK